MKWNFMDPLGKSGWKDHIEHEMELEGLNWKIIRDKIENRPNLEGIVHSIKKLFKKWLTKNQRRTEIKEKLHKTHYKT